MREGAQAHATALQPAVVTTAESTAAARCTAYRRERRRFVDKQHT